MIIIIESSNKANYNTKICLKLWYDTNEKIRKTSKRKKSSYTGTIYEIFFMYKIFYVYELF